MSHVYSAPHKPDMNGNEMLCWHLRGLLVHHKMEALWKELMQNKVFFFSSVKQNPELQNLYVKQASN